MKKLSKNSDFCREKALSGCQLGVFFRFLSGVGFESRWAHLPRFRDIPATRPFFVFLCITGFTQGFAFEPKKLGPSRKPSDCPAENQTDAGSENRIAARELIGHMNPL